MKFMILHSAQDASVKYCILNYLLKGNTFNSFYAGAVKVEFYNSYVRNSKV